MDFHPVLSIAIIRGCNEDVVRNQLFSIRIDQIYCTATRYIQIVIYITLFYRMNSSVIDKFLYLMRSLYYSGLSVVSM